MRRWATVLAVAWIPAVLGSAPGVADANPRTCSAIAQDLAAARAAGKLDAAVALYRDAQAVDAHCEAKALFCLGRSVALAHVEAAYAAGARGDAEAAEKLFEAGRPFGAPWPLLVGLGDAATAAARSSHDSHAWGDASLAYQQALAALDEPALCADEPPRPDRAALTTLSEKMTLATLLATPLRLFTDRCAPCGLPFLAHGVPGATQVLPITFVDSGPALTPEGRDTVRSLAGCARALQWTRLTVSVHADARGSAALNRRLSIARTDVLRHALQDDGFSGALDAEPVGKSRPLPIDAPSELTAAEIERANRRVELRPETVPALCTAPAEMGAP